MTTEDKLEKIKKLADAMYYAAANLGPNVGSGERLRKTMREYYKFIIHEYNKEDPNFKVGDTIQNVDGDVRTVVEVGEDCYKLDDCSILHFNAQDKWEECNITGIKSRHATGKLKECIDNQTEEGLEQARKQLEENPQECMYARGNYTDEDRKVLCDGCEEKCEYAQKEDVWWLQELHNKLDSLSKEDFEKVWAKYHQKEEPVSEDLEDAVNAYIGYAPEVDESSSTYGKRQAFKAGAKWQRQKDEHLIWQTSTANYEKGIEEGKQQMIKDAVDGVITFDYYKDDKVYGCVAHDSFCLEDRGLRDCDKVKIIVAKED